ncbi:Phosphatidylinositol transfer protein [Spraguea lophii 42_110]|uniref:Phosphatidylinositol transfer protein n=1 Tax=Spraguea lophii (strain 42_110) TaxID=1358809 RepID=S7XSE2_SPRLO|nr:Phosphatidylinositol transfer protein [Spraguea lophii 42_110]
MATTKRVEFRIPLPFHIDKYLVGQLYTVAHMSQAEAKKGSPIQILENYDISHEKYGECRKTKKLLNISKKVPSIIKALVPKKALLIEEIAYNAFPNCVTTYTNQQFKPEKFNVSITSTHLNGYEQQENVFGIEEEEYKKVKKVILDVSSSPVDEEYDTRIAIVNHMVCPMNEKWIEKQKEKNLPMMYCYKLVEINSNIWGGSIIAKGVISEFSKMFLAFHQQLVCTMCEWENMNLDAIRVLEDKLKEELEQDKDKINENIE